MASRVKDRAQKDWRMDALLYKLRVASEYILLQEAVKSVGGWLASNEGYLLYLLARHGQGVGEIVEIGSFMGLSTCWLAFGTWLAHREKVWAVDTFQGSPQQQRGQQFESSVIVEEGSTLRVFKENVERMGLSDYVVPIVGKSREVSATWTKPIRLLFIDGDHAYEQCAMDFQCWSPFVVPGGCIAFHDYGAWAGVTQFYDDLMKDNDTYCEVPPCCSTRVIQRRS